jgi:hypothetical protein
LIDCPALPSINTPVPEPGFAPKPTLMRPFVGHDHLGEGCAGMSGSGLRLRVVVDDFLVEVPVAGPLVGISRMTCPG